MYLEKEGYVTDQASNGREALDKLCEAQYDLLIADWMMPGMNGIELCREIRSYSIDVKILMLTAKSETEHEITGLSCGADDYVRKPFDPQILMLRVRKLLQTEDVLKCGNLVMDEKKQTLFCEGREIRLTQKEWSLLSLFLKNIGITLTRELLLERIWGIDYDGDERTLDTHIRRLRNKIGREYITTYVGMGYRMAVPHE